MYGRNGTLTLMRVRTCFLANCHTSVYLQEMVLTHRQRKVDVEKVATGEVFSDEADVVISARGGLNDYVWPKIDGLWSFKGKIVHSAAWDTSYGIPVTWENRPTTNSLTSLLALTMRTRESASSEGVAAPFKSYHSCGSWLELS